MNFSKKIILYLRKKSLKKLRVIDQIIFKLKNKLPSDFLEIDKHKGIKIAQLLI